MKKLILAAALAVSVSTAALACDTCGPLVSEVVQVGSAGVCAPLPEVCKTPAPVEEDIGCIARPIPADAPLDLDNIPTAAPAKRRAAAPAPKAVVAPKSAVVVDYDDDCDDVVAVAAPVKPAKPGMRQVMEEETYVENVTRTVVEQEERTRTKTRKIKVPSTKLVSVVDTRKVRPMSGKAPRIARTIRNVEKPITVTETETYEETYTVPVTVTYTEPVTKTRMVAKWVPIEE